MTDDLDALEALALRVRDGKCIGDEWLPLAVARNILALIARVRSAEKEATP